MNSGVALFRQPYAEVFTRISGAVVELPSIESLDGCQGFVVAPFRIAAHTPLLLIRPDRVEQLPVEPDDTDGQEHPLPCSEQPSDAYTSCFSLFHSALQQGRFRKLVLARSATVPAVGGLSPTALFMRACSRYPRLFIALVSTPRSGTWLVATPEILLERDADHWRTIALAGTMRYEGEARWSQKDIQEQRYVASFIADRLGRLGIRFTEEGPRTVRAAHLVHLRSDFTFPIYNNYCTRVGQLLSVLHPTPAVCGLPQAPAFDFILGHEASDRSYYSGFMGPLDVAPAGTHLYVTLRCMQAVPGGYRLYAGGGLLPESTCQREWAETEAKMDTMRRLLTPSSSSPHDVQ